MGKLSLWQRHARWLETCDREIYSLYCLSMGVVVGVLATCIVMMVWP